MRVYLAPEPHEMSSSGVNIFLGGSIEMGAAIDWQTEVTNTVKSIFGKEDVNIFNPRREDWDSSWAQDPSPGTKFNEQVNWELDHLDYSDIIIFNFEADTKSPITLLELGLHLNTDAVKIIVCPKDFYRFGNVALTAERGKNILFFEERDKKFYRSLVENIQRLTK